MKISRVILSLLVLSGMAGILFVVRYGFTGELIGFGLFWNLFLAWLPLAFAYKFYSKSGKQSKFISIFWFGLWLLFFPNAPYIITDLIHLDELSKNLLWFDSVGIFIAAFTGLALAIISLQIVHQTLDQMVGNILAWLTVSTSLIASSFGIYLGRNLRFNSWDIVSNPKFLLTSSLQHLNNPMAIKVTLVFSFVMFGFYLSYKLLNIKSLNI